MTSLTQRSRFGLQNSLTSLVLDTNNIEALPVCLFFGFRRTPSLSLKNNPLRCDCDALWLSLYIDGLDTADRNINAWECASPQQHEDELLKNIERDDLCSVEPTSPTCEAYEVTTTPSGGSTTSTGVPINVPLTVMATDTTATTIDLEWQVGDNADSIQEFSIECSDFDSGQSHATESGLAASKRSHTLEDLPSNTHFLICLKAHVSEDGDGTRACTDERTLTPPPEEEAGSSALRVALGSLLGVLLLALLIGGIIIGVVLWRRRQKRFPSPISKSTQSLNSATLMVG